MMTRPHRNSKRLMSLSSLNPKRRGLRRIAQSNWNLSWLSAVNRTWCLPESRTVRRLDVEGRGVTTDKKWSERIGFFLQTATRQDPNATKRRFFLVRVGTNSRCLDSDGSIIGENIWFTGILELSRLIWVQWRNTRYCLSELWSLRLTLMKSKAFRPKGRRQFWRFYTLLEALLKTLHINFAHGRVRLQCRTKVLSVLKVPYQILLSIYPHVKG